MVVTRSSTYSLAHLNNRKNHILHRKHHAGTIVYYYRVARLQTEVLLGIFVPSFARYGVQERLLAHAVVNLELWRLLQGRNYRI